MKITGYINDESSNLQPLKGIAILEAGATSGKSDKALVKITIDDLAVLKSVNVNKIIVDEAIVFGEGAGALVEQVGNVFYYRTGIADDEIGDNIPIVEYSLSIEDLIIAIQLVMAKSAQGICGGTKTVTPGATAFDYPSYIENTGVDGTITGVDEYGNTVTTYPMTAGKITASRFTKVTAVSAGVVCWRHYSK